MLFATLAAIALAEAHRTDQLPTALGNWDVIVPAKGISMERYRLTADADFARPSHAFEVFLFRPLEFSEGQVVAVRVEKPCDLRASWSGPNTPLVLHHPLVPGELHPSRGELVDH
jgi:hypothetical protein